MSRRLPKALAGGLAAAAGAYWGIGLAAAPPVRKVLEPWVLARVRTERRAVALTFDDGPDPEYTPRFLEALNGAPATFFVLGDNVRRWPDVVERTLDAGCEIACHGQTHRALASLSPLATVSALRRARDTIAAATGSAPRYYRPAYGVFNLAAWIASPRLGMRRTLWSAWARDWEETATPVLIEARTIAGAEPGALLLLHDSDGSPQAPSRTLAALPGILAALRDQGLEPATLSGLVDSGLPSTHL